MSALLPSSAHPPVIVLVEPDIPANTGNITRLCACTGARLYLVGKLGFRLDDKFLTRAAMDYRHQVAPIHKLTFHQVMEAEPGYTPFFLSSKVSRAHWAVPFPPKTMLVFGSETKGLPADFLSAHTATSLRIPMVDGARSLNLANSVAIVLYEALRQHHG